MPRAWLSGRLLGVDEDWVETGDDTPVRPSCASPLRGHGTGGLIVEGWKHERDIKEKVMFEKYAFLFVTLLIPFCPYSSSYFLLYLCICVVYISLASSVYFFFFLFLLLIISFYLFSLSSFNYFQLL